MRGRHGSVVHMAIVYRGGRAYSYKSVRRDGRVTSEYRGCSEAAIAMERLEAYGREDRALERFEDRAKLEALDSQERPLIDYFNRVEDLARSALYAAGYH